MEFFKQCFVNVLGEEIINHRSQLTVTLRLKYKVRKIIFSSALKIRRFIIVNFIDKIHNNSGGEKKGKLESMV